MKVLGISCNYHDASAALVIDGKVVAAAAEERFSRQKHDPSFPVHAIRYCLGEAGLAGEDLDLAAFHEDSATKLSRTLATAYARFPFSLGTFLKSAKDAVTGGFWVHNDISKHLGISPRKVVSTPHHMSHAAHAFLTSPFSESAVMTLDAIGEWTASAIFHGKWRDGRVELKPLDVSPFPHSLGLLYSAFTAFLGFKVNDGECSTMALAAFGRPAYADQIRKILKVLPDGSHEVDMDWFDFSNDTDIPMTGRFLSTFGSARPFKKDYPFDCLGEGAAAIDDDQRHADIAASLQVVLEEAVIAWAKRAKRLTGLPHLCYAGGVALNCVANRQLVNEDIFEQVYIPPDPGDGGGAMGAALYAHAVKAGFPRPQRLNPFYGEKIKSQELTELQSQLTPERWHHFSKIRPAVTKKDNLSFKMFNDDGEMLRWTAQKLWEGRSVGWCQGPFENGPRALGGRSILLRPDAVDLARKLSARVKLRARFRPYAASLTEDEARRSLELSGANFELTSRWMQSSYQVKPEALQALRAATHSDGTTRAQCVSSDENPLFHGLLVEYGKLSGREALLNTSFNESGFPLVASATDALLVFARTDLDVLVVGRQAMEKNQ